VLRALRRAAAAVLVLAGAVAATSAPAAAGYVFVDESGDQTLLATGRVKISPTSPDAPTFMLDMTRARLWMANPGRRTFWEGTVDEYCASVKSLAGGAMGGMGKTLDEQLKDLPPAERARIQALVEGAGRPPAASGASAGPVRVTVERTAHTETIAGWPTRKYRVLADGKLYEELWLTADTTIARELDAARVADTFGRMMGCMLGVQPADGIENTAEYRQLYMHGWPLKSVYYGGGGASGKSTVIKAERRDIAEREFAMPARYRRVPFADLFGAGGR
jgi:hypothetical protein